MAKIELSKLAASIIRDYTTRQADPQQEWSYEAYFNIIPHSWPVYVDRVVEDVDSWWDRGCIVRARPIIVFGQRQPRH